MGENKKSVLVEPEYILLQLDNKISKERLEEIVHDLYTDGYFDLVYSDRRGQKVYCITLTEKGKGYSRNTEIARRNLLYRLVLTVGFAILSFIIGLVLKALF